MEVETRDITTTRTAGHAIKRAKTTGDKPTRGFTLDLGNGITKEVNTFLETHPQYKPRFVQELVRKAGTEAATKAITGNISNIVAGAE